MDCIEGMKEKIPDSSVDMILTDLPYGTTACKWDTVIPFEPLWEQYERVIKDNGAIVLTASQPFTSALVMSKPDLFKYEWTWVKNRPTNFAHAKNKPMKKHENVLVFSKGTTVHIGQSRNRMNYFPQGLQDTNDQKEYKKRKNEKTDTFFSDRKSHKKFKREKTGYPHTILEFKTDQLGLHPTSKPVKLFEYLIKTYTNEGGTVLDSCMGSGTTAVAAMRTNRNYIGFETESEYIQVSQKRIEDTKELMTQGDLFTLDQ